MKKRRAMVWIAAIGLVVYVLITALLIVTEP